MLRINWSEAYNEYELRNMGSTTESFLLTIRDTEVRTLEAGGYARYDVSELPNPQGMIVNSPMEIVSVRPPQPQVFESLDVSIPTFEVGALRSWADNVARDSIHPTTFTVRQGRYEPRPIKHKYMLDEVVPSKEGYVEKSGFNNFVKKVERA